MKKPKQYIPQVKPSKKDQHQHWHWNCKVDLFCQTNGNGLWSQEFKRLRHKKLSLNCFADSNDYYYGFTSFELRVYFNKKDWEVENHGLVYTDSGWIKSFRQELMNLGFSKSAIKDLNYSEQGMQGSKYISLDAGIKFAKEYFDILYHKE